MGQRKDKFSIWFEEFRQRSKQGFNICHIEECHIGKSRIEDIFAQRKELSFLRRIDDSIFDKRAGIFASRGPFDQIRGEVESGHVCAQGGETARGQPVAAGDIQDALAGLPIQERSKHRPAKKIEEIIAFIAHARVPDLRIGFPGITCKLVGSIGHASCFTIKKK